MFNKIMYGFVTQTFNDNGECIQQYFTVSCCDAEFQALDGTPIDQQEVHSPINIQES